MKKLVIFLFTIFLVWNVCAKCSEGQVDINSASLEDLDKIRWVGEVTAEEIINERLFDSVDDLIRVSGIGEFKLAEIKEQGLACVEDEANQTEEEDEEETYETESVTENEEDDDEDLDEDLVDSDDGKKEVKNEIENVNLEEPETEEQEEVVPIRLNAKTIKSDEPEKKIDKAKFARYGFVFFCGVLAFLFIVKMRKPKDEFEE